MAARIRICLATAVVAPALMPAAASAAGFIPPPAPTGTDTHHGFTYDALVADIESGRVRRAIVNEQTGSISVELRDGRRATTGWPPEDGALLQRLVAEGADVTIVHGGRGSLASDLLEALLLVLFFSGGMYLYHRYRNGSAGGPVGSRGGNPVGAMKLRKGVNVHEPPLTRFADVAGCDEAVEELREIIEYVRNPSRFRRVGAKLPTGVLLFGPPGTGKTLLARALAGESGRAFYAVAGSEFVELFVGAGAKRVRELFQKAKAEANGAIIFIDELDALGRVRQGQVSGGGNDERDQTLNQLLVELDGFTPAHKVICVGATNRRDVLDPALLRPGRFGRQIEIGLPAERGRAAILAVSSRSMPLADDVSLERIADVTAGFSGAQLAELANEAALLAARADRQLITAADFAEAQFRILAGPAKRDPILAEGEDELIAFHEAGHVLCAELCPRHDNAQSATVRPRGGAGGLALIGQRDRALVDPELLHEQMVVALGGRAAEQTVFGRVSSGAANDLEIVNAIARSAIERLGFSSSVGHLVTGSATERHRVSERTLATIDREVERAVGAAYRDAHELVQAHRAQLDRLAGRLRTQRDLGRVDIMLALEGTGPATLAPALSPERSDLAKDDRAEAAVVLPFAPRRRRPLLDGIRERVAAFARHDLKPYQT
jgi:cell division protease FtsH